MPVSATREEGEAHIPNYVVWNFFFGELLNMPLLRCVSKTIQRVEKVGIELVPTTIQAQNIPKSAYLVLDLERKRVPR